MEKNIHKLNPGKYSNLDDHGFVKEETYVTDSDILCAKCFKTNASQIVCVGSVCVFLPVCRLSFSSSSSSCFVVNLCV